MKRIQVLLRTARRTLRRLVHKSRAKNVVHDQTRQAHAHIDVEAIKSQRNISRFFVEQRHITWVLLIGVCVWGYYSYQSMPQRKDPDTPVKTAVAITVWPGVSAEKIEQLVTRKIEEKVGQNANVEKIRSISRTNISVVYVDLDENFPGSQIAKEFDDIALKLDSISDLPDGAGPINFIKDFGDTSALMLTVASPKVSEAEIDLRAKEVGEAIARHRAQYAPAGGGGRFTIVSSLTHGVSAGVVQDPLNLFADYLEEKGVASDLHVITEPGFAGVDGVSDASDEALLGHTRQFISERLQAADFHPDSWPPVLIRDPRETRQKLSLVAGDKYSYREMDDFTDLIEKGLKSVPQATKVSRSGILPEKVFLLYSQERIASYGLQPGDLQNILSARNITPAGGQLEAVGKNFSIDPSGEFKSETEIGDVAIARTEHGAPVYLRDVVDVERGYDSPARYLNFYDWRDAQGNWQRSRAITVAVQMRPGGYIGEFGESIDAALAELKKQLPDDLIMARTSDQPRQVTENVGLFMNSLYEAIILVVIISLIGFWDWRSALLMGLAIPLTLFITFGMSHTLGIDLQQVSIATLIIALGLLVDVPVVAGDAIKNSLGAGLPPLIAAWLGPTKLIKAIIFATITNIVAYLPFLTLPGGTGEFLYSLPIVLTCSLVAALIVAMTFIPFIGYFLLKPKPEPPIEERRKKGFAAFYYRVGEWSINHRWKVLLGSLVLLAGSGLVASRLKTDFFPKDLSYLSYLDVWLPEDAPLSATNEAARRAEEVVREVTEEYGREHTGEDGKPREVLKSLTTFVGGGGPRFWFSVSPELQQLNYAQVIIEVNDKHDTSHLLGPLQRALDERIPGARVDVRQLDTGKPITMPVEIRISGGDMAALRQEAEKVKNIMRATQYSQRVRDDWGEDIFAVKLETDSDRANAAGITNLDVAASSATGINGSQVSVLREGDEQIPIVARLRMEERAQLSDVQNLYVYSMQGAQKTPLRQVSSIGYGMQTEKVRRRNQYRTITVSCMAEPGHLPSEIMNAARPQLMAFAEQLPSGYRMDIGGTEEEQVDGFADLVVVLLISIVAIYLTLVFQFKNAIKPFVVFAAVPYGLAGGLVALWIMDTPFGFMAFLGIISLIGLIISHIIVLFDFIEEKHEEGEPLKEAVLDAGIMRLRPVMITVLALVIALVPLALHGGPLWEPMCYAQMGGMLVATFVTLLLVPVIYSIFVLDLKLIKWKPPVRRRKSCRTQQHRPLWTQRRGREAKMRRHNIQPEQFMGLMMWAGLALTMLTTVQPSHAQQRQDAQLQQATTEFKSNLEQLLALYEDESKRAEAQLAKVKELLAQGLVTRTELKTAEDSATRTQEKVAEAQALLKSADMAVAEALVEAEAEESTRKVRPTGRAVNTLVQTRAFIRYGGARAWSLSEAAGIKQFFARRFGRALPIGAFGQSALHNRWGYDHRNAMDVGVHPGSHEGQALMEYLRANGIPFLAFHFAVPGVATGPHIHIGLPSHRIAPASLAANAGNISRQ